MRPYSEIHITPADCRRLRKLIASGEKRIKPAKEDQALIANELLLENMHNVAFGRVGDNTYRVSPLAEGYLIYLRRERREAVITRVLAILALIISIISLLSEAGILRLQQC